MRRQLALLGVGVAAAGLLTAANPPWWTTDSTAIIDPASPHDTAGNYNVATVGQLKNVAKKAALYLNTLPAPGAGTAINTMVAGFTHQASDYDALTLGQLKAVAKPFYDRLLGAGFDTKQSLRNHGVTTWAFDYPWNPVTSTSENYNVATVGQLKWVFSFDLTDLATLDSDADGMPNVWEAFYGLDPNGNGHAGADPDGDGTSNLQEYQAFTSPRKKDNPLLKLSVNVSLK